MKNFTDVLFPQIVQQQRMNLLVWFTVLCVDKYLQNQQVVQNIFGRWPTTKAGTFGFMLWKSTMKL